MKPYCKVRCEKDKSHWLIQHTIDSGALAAAKQLGTSVVIGHHHTRFGINAFNNGENILYGVDAGCLISDEGSPFKYNKTQIGRPIRGLVMIIDGKPELVRM